MRPGGPFTRLGGWSLDAAGIVGEAGTSDKGMTTGSTGD
jgi:hypothetical protein